MPVSTWRIARYVFFFLLLAATIISGLRWQYDRLIHQSNPIKNPSIRIASGSNLKQISAALATQKIITSAHVFRLYTRWKKQQGNIKAGEYHFDDGVNMIQVLEVLTTGKVIQHQITIVEGLRTAQVLQWLATQTNSELKDWETAMSALMGDQQEGYLLPETYNYLQPIEPIKLLQKMIHAQQAVMDELQIQNPQDIRIIASIIEKETALGVERPLIASVIKNRLQKGMPLQMDPTVIYGLWRTQGGFSGKIHRVDLQRDTPWNSYTRSGLPISPICNPSRSS
ncbi:MAG: endolytic transglycosylase MltG, partial [Mariprofundaceae bacterium]|nr:endolytic transglycosylase MltG [Mariprofundaceae bacterium]